MPVLPLVDVWRLATVCRRTKKIRVRDNDSVFRLAYRRVSFAPRLLMETIYRESDTGVSSCKSVFEKEDIADSDRF